MVRPRARSHAARMLQPTEPVTADSGSPFLGEASAVKGPEHDPASGQIFEHFSEMQSLFDEAVNLDKIYPAVDVLLWVRIG